MEKGEFFAYSWHIDEDETECTVIRIYGLDEKNNNTCVIVRDFTPYVYLQLPEHIQWDVGKAQLITSKLDFLLKERKPLVTQLMYKKRLYYANIDKREKKKLFPYLFCSFSHTEDIKHLGYKLRQPFNIPGLGAVNVRMHEHNANPILQLTSLRELPAAGWISFAGKKIAKEEQITYCDNEYIVKWKNLAEKKSNTIARPLIMGYDLEVNSSVPSAMPKAGRPHDKIFQISCVLARQGAKPETYQKYLLTFLSPDLDVLAEENIELLLYETEDDLIVGFTKFIQDKQPNVIIGYNIFGFDTPYMIERAKLSGYIYDFDRQGMNKYGHAKEKVIQWSSSAYKNQSFTLLDAEGRIFVDLLPIVKRDYKMSNYQLKTIAAHFLKDMTKDPLDAKAIFKCYRLGLKQDARGQKALAICAKYCVKDSLLVVRLFEVLTTWVALCEMSKVTNVPIFLLYTQGQQLKVFSQVYKKCTHENTVVEKDGYLPKENEHYAGATVFPPVPGVYDKVIPFDFSSLYPTTIIAYNICWSTLVDENDTSIPDDKTHIMEWKDHYMCEHDPKQIRLKELNEQIKKCEQELKETREKKKKTKDRDEIDFYDQKIRRIDGICAPLRKERVQLKKSNTKHVICANRRYRWLKSPKGVLPEILTHLIDTRTATKKEMKAVEAKLKGLTEQDSEYFDLSTYRDVLDQRQLALKVSANSGYGCMGVRRGYLPFMPGAMCTTYKGRCAIEQAAKTIQQDYGGILVYGDTDSNYVTFPQFNTAQECWDHAVKVAQEVSKLFPRPMSLAFEEKLYWRYLIITKKRYMSLACKRDGKIEDKINKKGVLLQRRDNCQFVRKVYGDVVMMIFNKTPVDDVTYYILQEINKLCGHFYPSGDFIITKSVGDIGGVDDDGLALLQPVLVTDENGKNAYKIGDYKVRPLSTDPTERAKQLKAKGCDSAKEFYLCSLPGQVQLAERMRRRGQFVSAGSRLEYVITTAGGNRAKQYEKIEAADYFIRHSQSLSIDYLYYLKQLSLPLDQLLFIIYGPKYETFVQNQYKYRMNVYNKMLTELNRITAPKLQWSK